MMTEYQKYQLQWMIDHGYSLEDLIQELDTFREECGPEMSLKSIFDDWEFGYGFGSEIWACEVEWEECEGKKDPMKIICLLGRSGSGKSTLQSALENLDYTRIITYTTRSPRGQEQDGREYHFVSREQFMRLVAEDVIVEYAEYSGILYGSPRPTAPLNVIVVEPNGYESICKMHPNKTFGVYIRIPDDALAQRVTSRQDTSSEEAARRIAWDKDVFADIEKKVDLVIDGTAPVEDSVQEIIRVIKKG